MKKKIIKKTIKKTKTKDVKKGKGYIPKREIEKAEKMLNGMVEEETQKAIINLFYGKGVGLDYLKKVYELTDEQLKEILDLGGEEYVVEIGVVGVDSGQVLICDPCYIDSQWKHEDLVPSPATIQFPDGKTEEVMCLSKRWFELIDRVNKGELKMVKDHGFAKSKSNFSYPACAEKTSELGYGQLNYELGHSGVGVVSTSGYGDGCYPVYATIEKETGRVKELRIQFF